MDSFDTRSLSPSGSMSSSSFSTRGGSSPTLPFQRRGSHKRSTAPAPSTNSWASSCFFITIRRSGRNPIGLSTTNPHNARAVRIPTSVKTRDKLRDYIWNEFEQIKAEVDLDRSELSLKTKSPRQKGDLKASAPIPWLSWVAPDGRKGQTRNKANFVAIWDRTVEAPYRRQSYRYPYSMPPGNCVECRWLSSILLPEPGSINDWSEGNDGDLEGRTTPDTNTASNIWTAPSPQTPGWHPFPNFFMPMTTPSPSPSPRRYPWSRQAFSSTMIAI